MACRTSKTASLSSRRRKWPPQGPGGLLHVFRRGGDLGKIQVMRENARPCMARGPMPLRSWASICRRGQGEGEKEEKLGNGLRPVDPGNGEVVGAVRRRRALGIRFALIAGSHEAAVRPGGERATFQQSLWGLGSQTMWAVISRRGDSGSVPPPPVQHGRLHAASKPVCDAVGEAEIDGGATARHKGATKTQTVMDWGREERFQCPRPLGRSSSNQSSLMADTHDMIQSQAQRQATGGFLEGFVPC
ncbi:hypothetical protein B2J93_2959 [Marssonina coronariae]|uniref:Uncharacterized protein n=1 Tax=Diplocarpon coronariae TaxID=2795749 RepID=A0A218Z599_9HELO|nr:hypothetical protein B2J93_2959 [Marssonina coronariae]